MLDAVCIFFFQCWPSPTFTVFFYLFIIVTMAFTTVFVASICYETVLKICLHQSNIDDNLVAGCRNLFMETTRHKNYSQPYYVHTHVPHTHTSGSTKFFPIEIYCFGNLKQIRTPLLRKCYLHRLEYDWCGNL